MSRQLFLFLIFFWSSLFDVKIVKIWVSFTVIVFLLNHGCMPSFGCPLITWTRFCYDQENFKEKWDSGKLVTFFFNLLHNTFSHTVVYLTSHPPKTIYLCQHWLCSVSKASQQKREYWNHQWFNQWVHLGKLCERSLICSEKRRIYAHTGKF